MNHRKATRPPSQTPCKGVTLAFRESPLIQEVNLKKQSDQTATQIWRSPFLKRSLREEMSQKIGSLVAPRQALVGTFYTDMVCLSLLSRNPDASPLGWAQRLTCERRRKFTT